MLALIGLGFEGLLLTLPFAGNLREALPTFLFAWTGLHGLMVLAFVTARRLEGRRAMCFIFLMAALFRLTLLPSWPSLSDDIFRYLWDGRLILEGLNPYGLVPSDPALAPLRDRAIYPAINSLAFHSVYPPLAQGVFAAAVALGRLLPGGEAFWSVLWLKTMFAGFDLAAVGLMLLLLERMKRPLRWGLLYAWNPLPIVEFAGSGHTDALLVFGLMLTLWACAARRERLASFGIAFAALGKALPALLVPFVLQRIGWRRAGWVIAFGMAGAWPLWHPERIANYLESVRLYFAWFEFNGGLYLGLKALGHWVWDRDISKSLGPALGFAQLAWILCVFARFGFGSRPAQRVRPDAPSPAARPLAGAFMAALGGYLVLATTVHPWYVTWVLPMVPLAGGAAWPWLAFATGFSYLAYASVPAELAAPWILFTWVPFALLIVWDVVMAARRRPDSA